MQVHQGIHRKQHHPAWLQLCTPQVHCSSRTSKSSCPTPHELRSTLHVLAICGWPVLCLMLPIVRACCYRPLCFVPWHQPHAHLLLYSVSILLLSLNACVHTHPCVHWHNVQCCCCICLCPSLQLPLQSQLSSHRIYPTSTMSLVPQLTHQCTCFVFSVPTPKSCDQSVQREGLLLFRCQVSTMAVKIVRQCRCLLHRAGCQCPVPITAPLCRVFTGEPFAIDIHALIQTLQGALLCEAAAFL